MARTAPRPADPAAAPPRRTLPSRCFTDAGIFGREMATIFGQAWQPFALAADLARPGDYVADRLLGEEVVVLRDRDGVLRGFFNVCQHRGHRLLKGKGSLKAAIACPYHAWAYGLDGRLRNAPGMERHPCFDREAVRLREIRHETWQGFVYVNLDGRAAPLAPRLADLEPRLAAYRLEDWVTAATVDCGEIPWDWKVMQDNGECYHHEGLHPQTFQEVFPGEEAGGVAGRDWTLLWTPAREGLMEEGPDGKVMPGCFFTPLAGLDPFQRRNFLLIYVLPNFFIYLQPDCGLLIRVVPLAAGRCTMAGDVLVPASARALPDYAERLARFTAFFERFNAEDTPVNTAIQKALEGELAEAAPLSHLEEHNRHVAWWVAAMLTGDPAARAALAAE